MDTPHPRLGQDIDQPREGGIYNDFCSETAAEQVHDAGTSAIDAIRPIISELTSSLASNWCPASSMKWASTWGLCLAKARALDTGTKVSAAPRPEEHKSEP